VHGPEPTPTSFTPSVGVAVVGLPRGRHRERARGFAGVDLRRLYV
jgi:hypothetical protein